MKQSLQTRLLALLLVVTTIFSLTLPAGAASIQDGSKTCTVALNPVCNFLQTTVGTWLRAGGYTYTTNDGLTGPAYCIDHGLHLTTKSLPITGKYKVSPKTAGAFANGYPQHTLETFLELFLPYNSDLAGLTEDEYRYATQLAVWATLGQLRIDGTNFTSGRERIMEPEDDVQQIRTFRAVQCILFAADGWDSIPQSGMYIRVSENKLDGNVAVGTEMSLDYAAKNNEHGIKKEVINGKSYYTKEYIFASATSTYYQGYTMDLWATGCPAGTMFADLNNVELVGSTWHESTKTWRLPVEYKATNLNENGSEFSGKAKLCIPVDTATPSGEITLHCAAQIMQYDIYLANNENTTQQSYIIADPSKGTMEADAVLSWGGPETELSKLQVLKVGGGNVPLAGAVFSLTGTDGSSRTGTTDENGIIVWERLIPGVTYTLTENTPPPGYSVVAPSTYVLTAGQITYATIKDDPQHTLTVHKMDRQTGYSLRGAVIRFEQIDGSFTTTAMTDAAGNVQMNADQLPIGSYRISEESAPEGYELDSTVQTVHWDGKQDVTLTFHNTRKPTLILNKQDSRTHFSLPYATFEVYKNGSLIDTVTTNENGLAYVSGIGSGYYEVKEITAPEGYTLNTETFGVNIDLYDPATADDPRLVITNDAKPSLRILKYDQQTGKPLADTSFEVYRDTVLIGTYTTEKSGEILLTGLEPGTYLVKEIATKNTHVVNSTPQQIELVAGQSEVAQLVFFNLLKPGIHLIKVDSSTLEPLANATYRISKVGGSFSKEYTTSESGEIDLSALEPGTYSVKETKAPETHLIDDSERIIQLNAGENAQFVFTDTVKPSLTILKYDPIVDKYLAGATFRIAKIEDGTLYLDRVTDAQGEITVTGLEPGVYSVTEEAAPAGYVRNEREYHVELFPGKTSEVVIVNEAKPDLKIVKTDAVTGEPVEGVTFTVRKADGSTITTEATDSAGEIFLENMEPGVIEVWEQSVPDHYLLNEEHQFITLTPNQTGTVRFQNYPKPGLHIRKLDAITGDPIQGAKFHITYASNNTFTGELNDLGTYYTDETGRITLTDLTDGWYRVEEVEPATGYALGTESTQDCFVQAGTTKVLTFENTPLSALVVWKYNSVTGEAVSNAVFQVKYLSGTSGTGGTVIGTYKTSVNGSFTVTGLKAGTYIVEELASDSGHVIDTAPQTVYISGEEQDVVQLYFGNAPKGNLLVTKVDAVTGEPLSDVEFMVTYADGSHLGNSNGKFVTDSFGTFTISDLTPGKSVIVKETKAKDGYVLDTVAQTAEIQSGKTIFLEFRNQPLGNLIIYKLDSVTGEPLKGVQFKITYADGSYVDTKSSGSSKGLYTTDRNGQIYLTGVSGTVIVTEERTISGYSIDPSTRSQTAVITPGNTKTLYFYNTPIGGVEITKVNANKTSERIPNTTFEIRKASGELVSTVTTDKNGRASCSLKDGNYYAVEIEAAEGFVLDDTPHYFEVEEGNTVRLRITNQAFSGIQIHKTDSSTGKGIGGVTFLLYDAKHNPIGQYTSDQNGWVYISDLSASGQYYVRELENEGYVVDTQLKSVYVEDGGTALVEWANTAECGQIQIIKKSADDNSINGLPAGTLLEGAVFEIYDKAWNTVDTIKTDKNGRAVSKTLPLSRYTLREVTAPSYYAINPTVMTAYLEYSGQIVTFEVEDESISTGVSIKKNGPVQAVSGQPVRYVFSNIQNTSSVSLNSFYWRDTLPAQVTLDKIVTGSYNQQLSYKVVYKTNLSTDYRTLADNLSTSKGYVLDVRPAVLGLAANERVTEVMFVFGTVKAGFAQVEMPYFYTTAHSGLANGTSIINVADVGGLYNGQWVQAVSRWLTTVYAQTVTTLPKTGY